MKELTLEPTHNIRFVGDKIQQQFWKKINGERVLVWRTTYDKRTNQFIIPTH